MTTHSEYRYSITVHTDDLAVLHCLRAIAQFAQAEGNRSIPWGNTKEVHWQANSHEVSFRFTSDDYRASFRNTADRVLKGLWSEKSTNDNDPATPARL